MHLTYEESEEFEMLMRELTAEPLDKSKPEETLNKLMNQLQTIYARVRQYERRRLEHLTPDKLLEDAKIKILEEFRRMKNLEEFANSSEWLQARDLYQNMIEAQLWTHLDLLKDHPKQAQALREFLGDAILKSGLTDGGPIFEDAAFLTDFIRGVTPYAKTPRPAGIENLLSLWGSAAGHFKLDYNDDTTVTFFGAVGLDSQKIHELLRISFLNENYYKQRTRLLTTANIPLRETMKVLGRKVNDRNIKKFAEKLRDEVLPAIAAQSMQIKKKDGSFLRLDIGGGAYGVDVKNDRITFQFSPAYAAYLNTGTISQIHSKAFSLGDQRHPLAYYLYIKLQAQYFRDSNRARNTHNILSLRSILKFCQNIDGMTGKVLPSYEHVQRTNRGHWRDDIQKPLENALNEIKAAGLMDWEYCKKGMAPASDAEINTSVYSDWTKLYITFNSLTEEPDDGERLKNRRERIEAQKKKKEIANAKIMVEADKIQRRKKGATKKKDA